jgi:hypothetical protein
MAEVQGVGVTTIQDTSFTSSLGEYFFPFTHCLISCFLHYVLVFFILRILKTQKYFSCFFAYLHTRIFGDFSEVFKLGKSSTELQRRFLAELNFYCADQVG